MAADFRFVRAFPLLLDGSDLDKQYQANAERILLQSVISTMSHIWRWRLSAIRFGG